MSADAVSSSEASNIVTGFDRGFVRRWTRPVFLLGTLQDQNSFRGEMDPAPLRFQALQIYHVMMKRAVRSEGGRRSRRQTGGHPPGRASRRGTSPTVIAVSRPVSRTPRRLIHGLNRCGLRHFRPGLAGDRRDGEHDRNITCEHGRKDGALGQWFAPLYHVMTFFNPSPIMSILNAG